MCSAAGVVTLIAGAMQRGFADGVGSQARLSCPEGLCCSADGSKLFVADRYFNRIRLIDTATQAVTTIVGTGDLYSSEGVPRTASISRPSALAFDETSAVPESAMFITCDTGIMRLSFATGSFESTSDTLLLPPNAHSLLLCTDQALIQL